VAGDFFWMEVQNGKVYYAAADCTGHGVPGAMMSVVCSNALSEALQEHKAGNTGELLDKTREMVIQRLAKSGEEVKDGMDISLCAIDFNRIALQWSGANNPLWIIRNGNLIEFKPDKQPIGAHLQPAPFTSHNVQIQSGDLIYVLTDGYEDQFGGPKGKKYKAAQLKEKLLSISNLGMEEQRNFLDAEFEKWRGNVEQVDDVCVIGLRIN
jgi:serine phosphatase RsbU (regulator of sigma subunit)